MTLVFRATYPARQAAAQAVLDGLASWAADGEVSIAYLDVEGGAVAVVVERTDLVFRCGYSGSSASKAA